MVIIILQANYNIQNLLLDFCVLYNYNLIMKNKLIIATRGSRLALAQADIVANELKNIGVNAEIITISTKGDKDRKSALSAIGGNGLFAREIENALLDGSADIAVHSAKDLSVHIDSRLTVPCTPKADSPDDVLVTMKGTNITADMTIGTGSPRRESQIKKMLPGCTVKQIRGNVDTRLNKLKSGEYDGIILARAGLNRLGLNTDEYNITTLDFVPSACQGIIAVQCRTEDKEVIEILEKISHEPTMKRFVLERNKLRELNVKCSDPVGIYFDGEKMQIYLG